MIKNSQVFGLVESFNANQYSYSTDVDTIVYNEKPLLNCAKSPMGSGHDNALKGIIVQFDLTFTVKAWTEAERYHWFEIVMSQSTMHRLIQMDFDKCFIGYVDDKIIQRMKDMVMEYNSIDSWWSEKYEKHHQMSKEEYLKNLKLRILYSCPTGVKLTARITTNYRQLRTIYNQRKNHQLPEWRAFCVWIETLPRAKELICNG